MLRINWLFSSWLFSMKLTFEFNHANKKAAQSMSPNSNEITESPKLTTKKKAFYSLEHDKKLDEDWIPSNPEWDGSDDDNVDETDDDVEPRSPF